MVPFFFAVFTFEDVFKRSFFVLKGFYMINDVFICQPEISRQKTYSIA